jgi:hypothetical protein
MKPDKPAFVRSWKVGTRTVTFTVATLRPGAVITAHSEWSPNLPRRMTEAEAQQYVAGRDRALRELEAELSAMSCAAGCNPDRNHPSTEAQP